MTKSIIALTFMFASLGVSAASINNAVRITSKVENGVSITRIFNGSLFATICRGEIRVLTASEEVIVKEVKKLVVSGDRIEKVKVSLDQEIIASEAMIECVF